MKLKRLWFFLQWGIIIIWLWTWIKLKKIYELVFIFVFIFVMRVLISCLCSSTIIQSMWCMSVLSKLNHAFLYKKKIWLFYQLYHPFSFIMEYNLVINKKKNVTFNLNKNQTKILVCVLDTGMYSTQKISIGFLTIIIKYKEKSRQQKLYIFFNYIFIHFYRLF